MRSPAIRNLHLRRLRSVLKKVFSDSDRNKILAAIGIQEGRTVTEIAHFFQVSRQSIYTWLGTPEQYFLDPNTRPLDLRGRPSRWTKEMDRLLEKCLRKRPFDFGMSALNWTIPVLITYFFNETGYKFSISTFHRKLHAHRLAWKRPRYSLLQDPELLKKSDAFVLE